MALDGALVDVQKLFAGLFVGFRRREWLGMATVPAPQTGVAMLENQHGSGRELVYTLENCVGRRSKTISKEQIQSCGISLGAVLRCSQDGSNLRTEPHTAVFNFVIDGLDAERISRDYQPPLALVPNRQAEHS